MRRIIRTGLRRNREAANFFLIDAGPFERVSNRIGIIGEGRGFGIPPILRLIIALKTNLTSSPSLLPVWAQHAAPLIFPSILSGRPSRRIEGLPYCFKNFSPAA